MTSVKSDCDPMDCSPPGSSFTGILQARILKWVFMLSSNIFSSQGFNLCLLCFPHWQTGSLPLVPPGKPHSIILDYWESIFNICIMWKCSALHKELAYALFHLPLLTWWYLWGKCCYFMYIFLCKKWFSDWWGEWINILILLTDRINILTGVHWFV